MLAEADVRQVLAVTDLFGPMEQALVAYSAGDTVQPLRSVVPVAAGPGLLGMMPAYLPHRHALGTKLVTVFRSNPARGLPTHLATIALFDEQTGQLRALVDGRYITEIRTAAVSAVAARRLARHDASRLAIVGSGIQARSHLEALAAVRPLSSVQVWSPTPAHLDRFVADMRDAVPCPVQAAAGVAE
jgi:ornithine cyclodeaminase